METYLTTEQLAILLGVKPATARHALCLRGHYLGLVPNKLPNGRLRWPEKALHCLLAGSNPEAPISGINSEK